MSSIFATSFLKWLFKFGGASALSLGILYLIFKIILKIYDTKRDSKERGIIIMAIIVSVTVVSSLAIIASILVIMPPPNIAKADSSSSNSSGSTNSSKKQNGVSKSKTIVEGDYVRFGTYDGAIIWKCITKDDNGTLLLASHILCQKPFDAGENGGSGSNKWANSNLREWLNSDEKRVTFSTQAPTKETVSGTPYADEPGFLYNFNELEKSKINKVQHAEVSDSIFILADNENLNFLKKGFLEVKEEYWTRTQDESLTYFSHIWNKSGYSSTYCNSNCGVLPALYLNSEKYSSGKGSKEDPYIVQ